MDILTIETVGPLRRFIAITDKLQAKSTKAESFSCSTDFGPEYKNWCSYVSFLLNSNLKMERIFSFLSFRNLKGQSHEKFGEIRVWGLSLGHN
jgi:hypothetical protein